jgi:signal peptidase II
MPEPGRARWFVLAAVVIAADQLAKWAVLQHFPAAPRSEPLAAFFNLVLVFNKGAAFSMLSQAPGWQTPLLTAFALVAAAVVSFLILQNPGKRMLCVALAAILGGALGNVIDRLRFGAVVDFLDFHAAGWHFPAFNVADSAITVGAALLVLEGLFHHEGRARATP